MFVFLVDTLAAAGVRIRCLLPLLTTGSGWATLRMVLSFLRAFDSASYGEICLLSFLLLTLPVADVARGNAESSAVSSMSVLAISNS